MPLDIKQVLASEQIPSLPAAAVKVLQIASRPDPDIKQLVAIIKCDPALTAKILRATNSSLFGFRQPITAIEQAVPLLGTIMVRALVLSFSLTSEASQPGPLSDCYQRVWRNSLIQAVAAEALAREEGRGISAEHFVAGLLQDVGVLALLRTVPEHYLKVLEQQDEQAERSLVDIERERLGFTHVQVSEELCQRWRLADPVRKAIASHHLDSAELERAFNGESARLAVALNTAAAVGEYFCRSRKGPAQSLVQDLVARHYKLEGKALHALLDGINIRVLEMAALYSLDLGNCPSYDDILAQANAELASIALEAQMANLRAGAEVQAAQRQISELESQREQFRKQVYRDYLTGLYNRHFFEKVLSLEQNRCVRYDESIGLILLDLDHFKVLNDTYGHRCGDEALKSVAQSIQGSVRESDIVARFGGEEFVILLLRQTGAELERTAERVRAAIEAIPLCFREEAVQVTASLGAVFWDPRAGLPCSDSELIELADAAMYEAKRSGANRICCVHRAADTALPFHHPGVAQTEPHEPAQPITS